MIMSLSPLDCDESGHVVRVDAPSDAKKKKKTRRGTRGARRTRNKWKPWSELTWEERRDLDAKGAAKPQQEHELVIVSKLLRKSAKRERKLPNLKTKTYLTPLRSLMNSSREHRAKARRQGTSLMMRSMSV
eukprot:m.35182 g.35182  ORF g.35182 m.35182 type:complete len:131 (+) comp12370_c1_seq6:126-518(+)